MHTIDNNIKKIKITLEAISCTGLGGNGVAANYDGVIIHTSNGGDTWTVVNYINPKGVLATPTDMYGVSMADEMNGVAVGDVMMGIDQTGAIVYTNDGGITWYLSDYTTVLVNI